MDIVRSLVKLLPYILVLVALVILLKQTILKKGNFFDVDQILEKYIGIFKNKSAKMFMFKIYILLIIISGGITYIKIIDKDLIDTITLIVSVLTTAFFGFVPILEGLKLKTENAKKEKNDTNSLLMFEILLNTVILILCFVYMFILPEDLYSITCEKELIFRILSFIIYYFVFILLIHVLMILKRVRLLILTDNE
jgi:hypothetical protein